LRSPSAAQRAIALILLAQQNWDILNRQNGGSFERCRSIHSSATAAFPSGARDPTEHIMSIIEKALDGTLGAGGKGSFGQPFSRVTWWIIAGVVVLLVVWGSYFTVDRHEVGIVTRWGAIQYTVGPGLHFKIPIAESATMYRTDIRAFQLSKVNTYTIDNQELDAVFTVNYRIPAEQAERVFREVPDFEQRLETLTLDRFKAEVGKVNVTDIAARRGDVGRRVLDVLQKDASRLFGLQVTDFQINNIDYTQQFRRAVDQAAVAKTLVERAEQQKRQAEVDADAKRITAIGDANAIRERARGDADANLLRAQADAQAIRIKGEAEAAAIAAQAAALQGNPGLIELRRAERWDGKLPSQVLGSAPIPFMPINPPTNPTR
jgi:regulator of protease activity HflC (stomatin/prohibitin superfamily)